MPAFLFVLDGTLVDSAYQLGTQLSVWRIHRRIGMSGGLLVDALLRETGRSISQGDEQRLQTFQSSNLRGSDLN